MTPDAQKRGRDELKAARRENRGLFWAIGLFSFFVNLLMLTGPLYMLQVYDRVLGSRSEATLLALTVLVAFLYGMMGLLDYARGRLLARIGARFQDRLDRRVFSAGLRRTALMPKAGPSNGLRDLEAVQRFLGSPVLAAFYDIPWTPIFIVGIFIFHPWLGWLALVGGALLITIALMNQWLSQKPVDEANRSTLTAEHIAEQIRNEAETVQSLGMRGATFDRWQGARGQALEQSVTASDTSGSFTTTSKTLRLFLQSAMLGLGAYLVLRGELTPGAMIAGSILLGRALQPVEQSIGQWAMVQRARTGWAHLAELLGTIPDEGARTPLPRPKANLDIQQITVVPPGDQQAALRMVSATIAPGQALGVIGPSGAGKSTLARAITGVWHCAAGRIRLDGATLDQYDPDVLGSYIGYLPQRVQLFDGSIAENIARLRPGADPDKIIEAAKKAAAHDMIVHLPEGYDTRVTASGGRLSGGQIQRIGLARAMFGDPVLLVLDEPNSNLDNEGSAALNAAIREMKAAGGAVLIMAHRPAAIQECELLLVLDQGARQAFGPRDEVLKKMVKNHAEIAQASGRGGGVS